MLEMKEYDEAEPGTITLALSERVAATHSANVARLVAAYTAAKSE